MPQSFGSLLLPVVRRLSLSLSKADVLPMALVPVSELQPSFRGKYNFDANFNWTRRESVTSCWLGH